MKRNHEGERHLPVVVITDPVEIDARLKLARRSELGKAMIYIIDELLQCKKGKTDADPTTCNVGI